MNISSNPDISAGKSASYSQSLRLLPLGILLLTLVMAVFFATAENDQDNAVRADRIRETERQARHVRDHVRSLLQAAVSQIQAVATFESVLVPDKEESNLRELLKQSSQMIPFTEVLIFRGIPQDLYSSYLSLRFVDSLQIERDVIPEEPLRDFLKTTFRFDNVERHNLPFAGTYQSGSGENRLLISQLSFNQKQTQYSLAVGVVSNTYLRSPLDTDNLNVSACIIGTKSGMIICRHNNPVDGTLEVSDASRRHGGFKAGSDKNSITRVLPLSMNLLANEELFIEYQRNNIGIETDLSFFARWKRVILITIFGLLLSLVSSLLVLKNVSELTRQREKQASIEREAVLQQNLDRARRMESVGLLAAGVAHDLNNVMGPMVAYPEMVLMQLPDDSPVRSEIAAMSRSAERAAGIVSDLLMLSRSGRYELKPTNINRVVTDFMESTSMISLRSEHPEVTVQINLDDEAGSIQGSSIHLDKIVMNLVVNAFEAMPDQGVLSISTSKEYTRSLPSGFDKVSPGDYVILRVRDTGSGIAEEDISSVFEPYFTRKTLGRSGTGLGLSVVYGIIKDHSGYYDIVSEVGRGTEFLIYFPATSESESRDEPTLHSARSGETILVVDDEKEQREVARSLLLSLGYKVFSAADASEAVSIQRQLGKELDLVLLDVILKDGKDGVDVYRELLRINPFQKALVVSGFAAPEILDELYGLGAAACVPKPYTLDRISRAIREELDRPVEGKTVLS